MGHWHGATKNTFMTHLGLWEGPQTDEPETVWGEHVTDDEYDAQPAVSR